MPISLPVSSACSATGSAVEARPVARPQVGQLDRIAVAHQLGVEARDVRIGEHDVVGRVAPDRQALALEGHALDPDHRQLPRRDPRLRAAEEAQPLASDLDRVPGLERPALAGEPLAVQVGPVPGAEIVDREAAVAAADPRVMSRRALVGEDDIVVIGSPQRQLVVERDAPAGVKHGHLGDRGRREAVCSRQCAGVLAVTCASAHASARRRSGRAASMGQVGSLAPDGVEVARVRDRALAGSPGAGAPHRPRG